MKEIQRADPYAQRTALLTAACATVIGLVVILLAESYRPALDDWISQHLASRSRLRLVFTVLAAAISAPVLGLGVYLWRLGDRVVRAERFPPPGFGVVRDTVVVRGRTACRRGRFIQLIAAILALVSCAIPVALWRIMRLLA